MYRFFISHGTVYATVSAKLISIEEFGMLTHINVRTLYIRWYASLKENCKHPSA